MRRLLLSLLMVLTWAVFVHGQQIVTVASQSDQEILARWKDPRNRKLVGGAFWTMAHDYADAKHMEEVAGPVERYVNAIQKLMGGDGAPLAQLGGFKAFQKYLSGLLNDEDEAVRALAATLLGVCGDKAYADQLATLLKPRKQLREMPRYDRGRAAMALGLVGARQYLPELVSLLKSRNPFDRSGAAYGLGALRATEHRRAVAVLLNDPEEEVRTAAKQSLDMMR